MKIIKIEFENISALKGEWEIDFEKPPLKGAGIFAITGPNGSGKTTILDAVSLGMYGRTSRLAIPGIQVMNPKTDACSAAVTFGVNGSRYLSSWLLESKNGKPPLPEMALFEIKEEGEKSLITNDLKQVRDQVAQLTGLDFNRFKRSVMLAQGEFASFLTAVGSEQIEVLENIVGEEIYESHPAEVAARADFEMEQLMEIKAALDAVEARKTGDVASLRQEIAEYDEQQKAAEERMQLLKQQRHAFRHQADSQKRLEEKQIALSKAQTRMETQNKDRQRLEKSAAAASLKKELDALDAQKAELVRQQQKLVELEQEASDLHVSEGELEKREAVLGKGIETIRATLSEKKDSFEQAIKSEKEMNTAHQRFREQVEKYEALEKAQQINLQAQVAVKEKIEDNRKARARVEAWLEKKKNGKHLGDDIARTHMSIENIRFIGQEKAAHDIRRKEAEKPVKKAKARVEKARRAVEKEEQHLEKVKIRGDELEAARKDNMNGHTYETLEARFSDQKKKLAFCRPMIRLSKAYVKLTAGNGKEMQKKADEARNAHAKIVESCEKEENILATLERVTKFETERQELLSHEPCPLCGSKTHPFVEEGLPFNGDAAQALKDQSSKVETLKAERAKLRDQMETLQAKHDAIESMKSEWKEMCEAVDPELPIGDTPAVKTAFSNLKKEYQKLKTRLRAIVKHRRKGERIEQEIQKTADRIAEKQMRVNELVDTLKIRQDVVSTLDKEGDAFDQKMQQEQAKLASLLAPHDEKPPKPGEENLLLDRLSARKSEYAHQLTALKEIGREGEKLAEEAAGLPEKLKAIKQESDAFEEQVKEAQTELTRLKEAQAEVNAEGDLVKEKNELESRFQQQQQEKEQVAREKETLSERMAVAEQEREEAGAAVKTLQASVKNLENAFGNQLMASGFNKVQEIHDSLLPEEARIRMETEIENTEAELAKCREEAEAVQSEVKENGALSDASPEQVEMELNETRDLVEQLADNIRSCKETLMQQQALQTEYDAVWAEYEAKEAVCKQLTEQKEFYAAADPVALKQEVRGKVFEQLVETSNQQLSSLSSRYSLKPRQNGESWGFAIEDRKNKGEVRSVDSLSGGEKFLVSLSLALGLSDMADSSRKIDSLFIDEGFGNLDEDALQNVLITLNNLKVNGKLVGVISHVKKFEERIPVQIRLSKQATGESQLTVMA